MYEYEYRPLVFILLGESALFAFLVFLFFIKRFFLFFQIKKSKKRKEIISTFIIECLTIKNSYNSSLASKLFKSSKELLKILVVFDLRFKDDNWIQLKEILSTHFLLPKARKLSRSFFWQKRSFASKCFALHPLKEDEQIIISLVKDKHFLVQNSAILASITLESRLGIKNILEIMSLQPDFSHYFFCDCLQKGSNKVISIIIELASIESLHLACLQALSGKSLGLPLPFLETDVYSIDLKIQLLAINLLSYNPTKNAVNILIKHSKNPNESIKRQAIIGLGHLENEECVKCLHEIFLGDDIINIKLEAAKALKRLGKTEILKNQNTGNIEAAEIATYILQFG